MRWPTSVDELVEEQRRLAVAEAPPWTLPAAGGTFGGCFFCSSTGKTGAGAPGEPSWAGAAASGPGSGEATCVLAGSTGASYEAGLLALREGPLLEAAARRLPAAPGVLLVDATGRDHPRRAGLALHLGAVLDLPSVGVTHRPLLATGVWPELRRGASAPLLLDGELVGRWLCTRDGTRPLAVHAAWRTDADVALEVVLAATSDRARTPEPLRLARRVARVARAVAEGRAAPEGAFPAGTVRLLGE